MSYQFKAHPTVYNGVQFRSRLEAQWAAYFDLSKLKWIYEPIDLSGWTPDFWLELYCRRECRHELYVEVKPYMRRSDFDSHPVAKHDPYSHPAPARFGLGPEYSWFETICGDGGGIYRLCDWHDGGAEGRYAENKNIYADGRFMGYEPGGQINPWSSRWKLAGNLVQWLPR